MKPSFLQSTANIYNTNDSRLYEDTLNWDSPFQVAPAEYSPLSALSSATFISPHNFTDWIVKLSPLDLYVAEDGLMLQLLTVAFAASRDYGSTLTHLNQVSNSIFHTEFQDWYVVGVYHTHEISLALRHLVSAQHHATPVLPSPAALFDSFADSTATTTAECSDYLGSFVPYVAYIVMLAGLTRIIGISNPTDVYTSRLLFYLYSASTTTRLQFEAMLQTFFFIVLYASVTMVTFDDDQEELFEVFHSACYYLLLTTLLYHLYRYSTHCLSYLEAAKSGSKATSLLAQSVFDGLNVFAYTLRFLVLVIRLNIYDGIDDMLDSYYILLADFEEDDYTYDAIVLICAAYSFDMDANDDRLFLLEDETDLFADLFLVYFTVWGKFATFWMFILEEIARVGLATYVAYLLIFEINALNRSYVEDRYIVTKRTCARTRMIRRQG